MESRLRAELEIKKELREIVLVNVMSIVGGADWGLSGERLADSILLNVKTRNDKSQFRVRKNENTNFLFCFLAGELKVSQQV